MSPRIALASFVLANVSISGTAAAQTTVLSDTFTGTNGTALIAHAPDVNPLGSSWTIASGVTPTLGGGLLKTSGASMSLIDLATANGTLGVWWYPGTSTQLNAGLVFRASDSQNFFLLEVSGNRLRLYKVQNGSWSAMWVDYLDAEPRTGVHFLRADLTPGRVAVSFDYPTRTFECWESFNSNARRYGLRWSVSDTTSKYDNFSFMAAAVPRAAATTQITPANASIAFGSPPQTYTATAYDSSGKPLSDAAFDWTSSNPAIAKVAASSMNTASVTAMGTGTATPARGTGASTAVSVTRGPYIAYDSFSAAAGSLLTDHRPEVNEINGPWRVSGASATINAAQRAVGSSNAFALLDGGTPNVTASVNWYPGTSPALGGALIFRATDDRNYFAAEISSDRFTVSRVMNGVATIVCTSQLDGEPRSGVHTLSVRLNGTTLFADWDFQTRMCEWPDTFNQTATKYGLRWITNDSTSAFDGFAILGTPPAPPHHVVVTPASGTLTFGGVQTFSAQGYDAAGQPMPNTIFNWSTSNAAIAPFTATAITAASIQAMGVGTATITATPLSGPSGSATVAIGPGNTLVYDNFNAANGTPLAGRTAWINQTPAQWTTSGGGNPVVMNDGRVHATGAAGPALALIDSGAADATVSAYWAPGTAEYPSAGLVFRAVDESNFYLLSVWADQLKLSKVVNGVPTSLWLQQLPAYPGPPNHSFQAVLSSAQIRVLWNGGIYSYELQDLFNVTATKHGLWLNDTSSTLYGFSVVGRLPEVAVRVEVTPSNTDVPFLDAVLLTASAYRADNTVISNASFAWTTTAQALRVTPVTTSQAYVRGVTEGAGMIAARYVSGVSGTASVSVNPGSYLIFDSFSGSGRLDAHVPDVTQMDQPWTVTSTSGDVVTNGRAAVTADTTAPVLALIDAGAPDAYVSVMWTFDGTGCWIGHCNIVGLIGRATDTENYLAVYLWGDTIYFDHIEDGHAIGLGRIDDIGEYLRNGSHRIELHMAGSALEVWLDGVKKMQATDSFNIAASKAGLYWFGAIDRVSTFDDFSVIGMLPPRVATLSVTPRVIAMAPYEDMTLTARALDDTGAVVPGAVVAWNSSNTAVARTELKSWTSARIVPRAEGTATIAARVPRGVASDIAIALTVRICVDALGTTSGSVAFGGGTLTTVVNAAADCAWRAVPLANWITATPSTTTSGTATASIVVTANPTRFTRTGQVALGGRLFTVTQPPEPDKCAVLISPGPTVFPAEGGYGTFGLGADPNCWWHETSSAPDWLIPETGAGKGDFSVVYRVRPNDGPWERSADIGVLNGGTYEVTQLPGPVNGGPPPPAGETLILDTFTAADGRLVSHVADIQRVNAAWQFYGAPEPQIIGGRVGAPSAGTDAMALIEGGASDASVSVMWHSGRDSVNPYQYGGLIARASNGENYLLAYIWDDYVTLAKVVDGQYTVLQQARLTNANGDHSIDMRLAGDAVEVWIDEVRALQARDSFNKAATHFGLRWWTKFDARSTFDDFKVVGALPASTATLSGPAEIVLAPDASVDIAMSAMEGGVPAPGAAVYWTAADGTVARVAPTGRLTASVSAIGEGNSSIVVHAVRGGAADVVIPVRVQYCVAPIAITELGFAASGGQSGVSWTAPAECSWQARSNASWLSVSRSAGSGSGSIVVSAAANPLAVGRTAIVSLGGRRISVNQPGQATSCVLTATANGVTWSSLGGSGTIAVSAASTCQWSLTSTEPGWLIPRDISGAGTATASFTVLPNTSPGARKGRLLLADHVIEIEQPITVGLRQAAARVVYPPNPPGIFWYSGPNQKRVNDCFGNCGAGCGDTMNPCGGRDQYWELTLLSQPESIARSDWWEPVCEGSELRLRHYDLVRASGRWTYYGYAAIGCFLHDSQCPENTFLGCLLFAGCGSGWDKEWTYDDVVFGQRSIESEPFGSCAAPPQR